MIDINNWNPDIETGITVLDDQHKNIINTVKKIYNDLDKQKVNLKDISFLKDIILQHLDIEEDIAKNLGFPQYKELKLQHDSLRVSLKSICNYYEQTEKFSFIFSIHLLGEIRDWIDIHYSTIELDFINYIKYNKGV